MTKRPQHENIPEQSELEKVVREYGFQKKGARRKHEWSAPEIEWKTFVSGDQFRFHSSLPTQCSIQLKQVCNQCGSIKYNRVYYTRHISKPNWHWELYRGNARIVYSSKYESYLCSSKKGTVTSKQFKKNDSTADSKAIFTEIKKSRGNSFEQEGMEAKRRIRNIIEEYLRVLASGNKKTFNEERIKIAFVIPLLEALGWKNFCEDTNAGFTEENFVLKSDGKKIFVDVKNPNSNLDGYRVTRDGPKNYATLAIQHAGNLRADWVILTNFEETRLYSSKARKPENALVWKIRFTDYETKFEELTTISREKVNSGILKAKEKMIKKPPEYDQITDLLKKDGPLTRKQILEKLRLSSSYKFPWFVCKFGSRRRKVYFLEGQEELAKEKYENMLKTRKRAPKHPTLAYQKDYFLNLLHLNRKSSYSPAPDGTPIYWERRSNRQYPCSICQKFIEKGERYIGRRKLNPGMRGIYGHRGTYSKDYYHILCLLRTANDETNKTIQGLQTKIGRLENEIAYFREEITLRFNQIKACRNMIQQKREDYEQASFWKKIGKWFSTHYTYKSKNNEIKRLENEIADMENRQIPERETQIINSKERIEILESYRQEIQMRMQELNSNQCT